MQVSNQVLIDFPSLNECTVTHLLPGQARTVRLRFLPGPSCHPDSVGACGFGREDCLAGWRHSSYESDPRRGTEPGNAFAVVLDDFVQAGHVRRVIAFFEKPVMLELGFERGQAVEAETSQPRRIRQSEFRQRRARNL
jgi:hypothetical protein